MSYQWILLIFSSALLGVDAVFPGVLTAEHIARLQNDKVDITGMDERDEQSVCSTIVSNFEFLEGCACKAQPLRNRIGVTCANACEVCSNTEDVCTVGAFELAFTIFNPAFGILSFTVIADATGDDSSNQEMRIKVDLSEDAITGCSTTIEGRSCSSCTTTSDVFEILSCIPATHDCRNLGIPDVVDGCDFATNEQLPSTNPFSALGEPGFNPDICLGFATLSPTRAPVPAPTSSPVPGKIPFTSDKDKDAMKLSAAEVRGGIWRSLRDRVRGDN